MQMDSTDIALPTGDVEVRRLTRPISRAQVGGVCAGLADHLGVSPLLLRAVFVILASWQFVGVVAYFTLWMVIPPDRDGVRNAPGVDAATRTGMRTAEEITQVRIDAGQFAAFGLVGIGLTWWAQNLGWGLDRLWLIVGVLMTTSLALVWWQADRAEGTTREAADGWRGWLGALASHWTIIAAHLVSVVCLGAAITLVLVALPGVGGVRSLLTALLCLLIGLILLAAPWLLRARRALARVREEKLLSDARADMAAHLHDSVLQTLALIQRQSNDPRAVARLARRQERELREWLYGAAEEAESLRPALLEAALEVEDKFPVTVECVTVGDDVELTPALVELVKAAREAMTNAAKHSGTDLVDVYAEVGEEVVEVFIRDRGRGFDPDDIADDRMGVRGSILERMNRHHGAARIKSHPGRGTEVTLEMRR